MQPAVQYRVALIHATPVSIEPIRLAFAELWQHAGTINIMDDSLGADLKIAGQMTGQITGRIGLLAEYGYLSGADGILFTCSAFGTAIAEARNRIPIPVLTPHEAMLEEALLTGSRIGLLATFGPTIDALEREFMELAASMHRQVELAAVLRENAYTALLRGNIDRHNQILQQAAQDLSGCDAVMLAQFSTSLAYNAVSEVLDCPVLSSPRSAVNKLKQSITFCRA